MFNSIVRPLAFVNVSVLALSVSAFASNPIPEEAAERSTLSSECQLVVVSAKDFYNQRVRQHERGGLEAKRERPVPDVSAQYRHLERKEHHRAQASSSSSSDLLPFISPVPHNARYNIFSPFLPMVSDDIRKSIFDSMDQHSGALSKKRLRSDSSSSDQPQAKNRKTAEGDTLPISRLDDVQVLRVNSVPSPEESIRLAAFYEKLFDEEGGFVDVRDYRIARDLHYKIGFYPGTVAVRQLRYCVHAARYSDELLKRVGNNATPEDYRVARDLHCDIGLYPKVSTVTKRRCFARAAELADQVLMRPANATVDDYGWARDLHYLLATVASDRAAELEGERLKRFGE